MSFWISRSFDLGDLGVLEKSLVNIFNDYIFEISLFHWSKCTIKCAIRLTLISKSAQARGVCKKPKKGQTKCFSPWKIFLKDKKNHTIINWFVNCFCFFYENTLEFLELIYCEKATKCEKKFHLFLTLISNVDTKQNIFFSNCCKVRSF